MGIALNLQIVLGSVVIFTLLILQFIYTGGLSICWYSLQSVKTYASLSPSLLKLLQGVFVWFGWFFEAIVKFTVSLFKYISHLYMGRLLDVFLLLDETVYELCGYPSRVIRVSIYKIVYKTLSSKNSDTLPFLCWSPFFSSNCLIFLGELSITQWNRYGESVNPWQVLCFTENALTSSWFEIMLDVSLP